MKLKRIHGSFTVCKPKDFSQINLNSDYCFLSKTDEELSLVCLTDNVPCNTESRDDGWRAFRIEGVLDFSLTGVLYGISAVLAKNKIGIFAVSTYNTDYILTKECDFENALAALSKAGYDIC